MEMSVLQSTHAADGCNYASARMSPDTMLLREEVMDRLYSLVRMMLQLHTGLDYSEVFDNLKKNFTMEKAVKLVMLMERHCTEQQFGEQKKVEQKFVNVFHSVRTYGADIMQMYLNV